MALKGRKQSPEHIKRRVESTKRTFASSEILKAKFRENGKHLLQYLEEHPEIRSQQRQKLSRYAKENQVGERLNSHQNTIKSRFKKGIDARRKNGPMNFSEETREKLSKKMSEMASKQVGDKHPRWKGGVGGEHQLIRNGKSHREWSVKVYQRDRFICQNCGLHCKKGNIIAHHLKSFAENEEIRFDIDNGKTFCRSCHLKIHLMENGAI